MSALPNLRRLLLSISPRATALWLATGAVAAGLAAAAAGQERERKDPPPKKSERAVLVPGADARKGKAVYETYCEICHHAASEAKKVGPGLKGIYKRGKFEDGKRVDDRSMREWILKGGKDMPGFEGDLTADELRHLIAYLRSL